jgi:hypothetical protein
MIELLAAMLLLSAAMLPLAYSLASEKKLARGYYQKVVAMEIVDGEIEVLAAGEWKQFPRGKSDYRVNAGAAANLPPGRFTLDIDEHRLRLEWHPAVRNHGGKVVREVNLQ